MLQVLLFLLIAYAFFMLLPGFFRSSWRVQYPFLVAIVFLGWVLPQLLVIVEKSGRVPGMGVAKLLFYILLCLPALDYGYRTRSSPVWFFRRQPVNGNYLLLSAILTFFGGFFFFMVSRLEASVIEMHGRNWTGVITIYFFFSQALSVGFALALLEFLRARSSLSGFLVVIGCFFYFDRIVFTGHRGFAVEFAIIVLMSLWFQRRWTPSLAHIVLGFFVGVPFIFAIHEYRLALMDPQASGVGAIVRSVSQVDFFGAVFGLSKADILSLELYNAAVYIEATTKSLAFDFGLSFWNSLVRNFLPGQLLGFNIKSTLLVDFKNYANLFFNHINFPGTTNTGFADTFQSFWFFGFLVFYFIGRFMKAVYLAAFSGDRLSQVLVMVVTPAALHSITHTSHHVFIKFIQVYIFMRAAMFLMRFFNLKRI
jgi:hypothetical protein